MTNREIDLLVDHRIFGVNPPPKVWARLSEIPRYSTDPAGWDQVLDKMASLGWCIRVEMTQLGKVTCCLWRSGVIFTGRANAKGHAICLSALEAVKGNYLIAAAPDLLLALKAAQPEMRREHDAGGGRFSTEQVEAVESAISKAEGRA